ncbi:sodium/glutamate symporter [Staphylococcus felis]|uniref:Sodium/glutamate symporter n=1 Tax=Staphylococcus felis TaxID=46127 RepID=A0A2K3ZA70_9STAP|nr:sodium/glutamate symporter [Staphylococcus felis]AVP36398.1 sodium/glutamate symporter [Staphylococcus felis]MBH9581055.1 sodium/glutamate symporter [Staphylococcus felis]MDM8328058.1 sodium/glutamate symporter [Staphylococcus felis]MDQ7193169.1 sodium/glutamate symporter [Staphylococcus felis]PNZ34338.1 sodium/glutamate symporter [Staphylococcus felis]
MITLNSITTLFIACLLLIIGQAIVNKVSIFNRLSIPSPVIGGLIFAILSALLSATGVLKIELDGKFFQEFFMLAFFTTIGLGASFKLLKLGGKVLIVYWILCGILATFQNVIGVSLAKVLHIDPLLGLTAGAMSMEGGHGNAAAYGQTIQELGIESAVTAALAAATLGLVAGGLIGGPVVRYLIKKYDLKPVDANVAQKDYSEIDINRRLKKNFTLNEVFFIQISVILFCMALGTYLGNVFSEWSGINIPLYVASMFIAVIIRNISEFGNLNLIDLKLTNQIGDISLSIFLSIALMSIQLTEIYNLALPLVVIVLCQIIFVALFSIFVVFRLLGKDYDAAVMIGGFIGHGLGATPNAMANLDTITKKFGNSPRAYLVVPIVGAFLVDLLGVPIITLFINFLK